VTNANAGHGSSADWEPELPGAAAAWLHGAAEALSVLSRRRPAERRVAARRAADLLAHRALPADWERIGFDGTANAAGAGSADARVGSRVACDDPAVLRLARMAVSLL
jgi:hypothetical protein